MSHNFFVKFNLDKARHELAQCKRDPALEYQWHRGFMDGAAGLKPSSADGTMARMGEDFGYAAWEDANAFRATRALNVAKRWAKKKEQPASSNQHLATSSVLDMKDGSTYTDDTRVSDTHVIPGVPPQTPSDPLAFENTEQYQNALKVRAELRAIRAAKEQKHA